MSFCVKGATNYDKERERKAEEEQARILAEAEAEAKRNATGEGHPFDHPFEADRPAKKETKGPEVSGVDPFSDEAEKPAVDAADSSTEYKTENQQKESAMDDNQTAEKTAIDQAEKPAVDAVENSSEERVADGMPAVDAADSKSAEKPAVEQVDKPAKQKVKKERKATRKAVAKAAGKAVAEAAGSVGAEQQSFTEEQALSEIDAICQKAGERITASTVVRGWLKSENFRSAMVQKIASGRTVGELATAISAALSKGFPKLKGISVKTIRELWAEAGLPTSRSKKA